MTWKSRTICPYFISKVSFIGKCYIQILKTLFKRKSYSCRDNTSIKAKNLTLLNIVFEILGKCRYSFIAHTIKSYTGSFDLLLCLYKITAVSPKTCPVTAYKDCSVRACKACKILSCLKKICCIFGVMKIRSWHHVVVYSILLHFCTKKGQTILHCHIFHFLDPSFTIISNVISTIGTYDTDLFIKQYITYCT